MDFFGQNRGCPAHYSHEKEEEKDMAEQLQFPELVDIDEAAKYLSTSIRHVRRLVQENDLPFVKIGGKLRFDKADLQRYIDEHRHPNSSVRSTIGRANRKMLRVRS
jgi:excisionase family DNA binding protein